MSFHLASGTLAQEAHDVWNFWVLRHVAALCVLLAHAFVLSGKLPQGLLQSMPFLVGIAPLGVAMFFAISGFLVSYSWNARPHAGRFLLHRVLRIMPGLCGAIVFAVVLGWAYTTLDSGAYWTSAQTWAYVAENLMLRNTLGLPGVFQANPVPQQMTGTFWTLPVEVTCYLWVLLLGVLGLLASPWRVLAVLVLALPAVLVWGGAVNPFRAVVVADAMPAYFAAFLSGMAVYHFRGYLLRGWRLPLSIWVALAVGSATAPAGHVLDSVLTVLRYASMAWALASLAAAIGRAWPEPRNWPDLSYGVYLYGFPIQQALVASFPGWSGWQVLAASLVLSAVVATLSWYVIESPALRRKRLALPGPCAAVSTRPGPYSRATK